MRPIAPEDWKDTSGGWMTDKQRRMLNAVCSDLSQQISWHGTYLSKDDWRHMIAGSILGWRTVPAIDRGSGNRNLIMLGRSSLELTRAQAADAITALVQIGDHPEEQGVKSKAVRWSDVVLLGLGFNPRDLTDADGMVQ